MTTTRTPHLQSTSVPNGLTGARLLLAVDGPWRPVLLQALIDAERDAAPGLEVAAIVADPASFAAEHPAAAAAAAVEIIAGSAADFTFPQGRFTHVVHAAFIGDETDPRRVFDIVIDGARRMVDFAADHGAGFLLLTPEAPSPEISAPAIDAAIHVVRATLADAAVLPMPTPDADGLAALWAALPAMKGGPVTEAEEVTHGAAEKPSTFVIDVDGVVAMLVPGNDYRLCRPIPATIAAINRLYDRGHRIIMMTARGSATGIDWDEVTRGQFTAWGLKYHELRFGKPAADYYVDDRMATVEMLCAMAAGRRFPPSSRAPRLSLADGLQETAG